MFIEETIRSILLQGYPDLEYFVLDGGSTDNTVEIIERYSPWIDFWVSEPDRGQSAAINRGLRMGSGSYATWINSDDLLCKDAFCTQVSRHQTAGDTVYVGDCFNIDKAGNVLSRQRGRVHCFEDLVRFRSVWRGGGHICQQEVLFPLQLAMQVGGLNEDNHYSMDYELWGRFLIAGARMHYTGIPFGCFRWHDAQKTQQIEKQTYSTLDAATALLALTDCLSEGMKQEIAADLQAYRKEYPGIVWKHTGRLARLGLPRSIVTPVRNLKRSAVKAMDFIKSSH
jgi:hypothetical protein